MHLGKAPGSLSPRLEEEYSELLPRIDPKVAWDRAVQAAIDHEVDAVLMLGDVVHEDNDAFLVEHTIERGVRRLTDQGIRVISVAGNHDAEALPNVVKVVPQLELLGADAQWEHTVLRTRADGAPFANLIGWSFPAKAHRQNPLKDIESIEHELDSALPTIGLLHCDLDQKGKSRYAPVARTELEGTRYVDTWLLGHVHTANFDALSLENPTGYLGALSPLKRTDCKSHGAWLMSIDGTRCMLDLVSPAALRFDEVMVDVEGVTVIVDLMPRIQTAIKEHLASIDRSGLEVFGARIRFHGRSEIARAIRSEPNETFNNYLFKSDETICFVSDVDCFVRSAVDLESMAKMPTAAGVLARNILVLERSEEGWEEIVEEASAAVVSDMYAKRDDDQKAPTSEVLRPRLAEAGRRALDELLMTRDEVDAH